MKLFEKLRTKKALDSAKTNLQTMQEIAKEAVEAVKADNSRANRKAVVRTQKAVESAEKRLDHIEIARGYQTEKHANKFVKKQTAMTKKAKTFKVKQFNKNCTPRNEVRYEWTDAKESAFWLDKLLTEQEIAQQKIDAKKEVMNLISGKASNKEAFMAYYNGLCRVKRFDGIEKTKERERRAVENYNASIQLDHPAMKAAQVFCEGLMAAGTILNKEPGELGGKHLFEGIAVRNCAIDDLKDQIDECEHKRSLIWQYTTGEFKEMVENCKKFNAGNDLDALQEVYEMDKRDLKALSDQINLLNVQIKELKAEKKVLNSALKELMDNASPAEKALIEARKEVAAQKARRKKDVVEGRSIIACDKPMLKSYKLMHFNSVGLQTLFKKGFDALTKAYNTCVETNKSEDASDDAKYEARFELVHAFMDLNDEINDYRKSGKKLPLDAQFAKIHNARQSQLTDIIGVPYGKTTDMIISISHNVVNILPKNIGKYLDDDPDIANKLVEGLMESLVGIFTQNGLTVKMLPGQDGKSRTVEYKFWNANNSQLKVGKGVALSDAAYERAAEVARAGFSADEIEDMWTNGSDMLKYDSYATTPGCPLTYIEDGQVKTLTVNDVLVVDSVDVLRKFRNVLVYNKDGSCELKPVEEIMRTAYDGQLFFMVPIPSQQIRGGFAYKGFGVCSAYEDGTTIVDEIAAREGWDIPEYIKDVDNINRRWRDYKVICTKDCWKWAGWKFGGYKDENGKIVGAKNFKYADYCARMNKLAEKYPTANMLYTARIADATEESKRQLTRQSIEQYIFATAKDIAEMYRRSIDRCKKLSTHAGVIRKMAGLDKDEADRTPFEHLIEACPEILDHPYGRRAVEDMFNRMVAEAAVRPAVDGIYPYIGEDPVAFFKIVLWDCNPNKCGLGYLTQQQVNIPNEQEGTKLYIVRYPNNYLCGQVKENHNDDIYRCCGNVMILSLDGGVLIRADGDTDGDEMCVIRDKVVVDLMLKSIIELKPPIISFPHEKLGKEQIRGKEARAMAMARAIVIANKYGPEVGKNSNLATKFMNRASVAHNEFMNATTSAERSKAKWMRDTNMNNAIIAHIAAIVAIDLAKTGSMPAWLQQKLDKIRSFAGKKMPWNQRFCKDNKAMPWFCEAWDDVTLAESTSVCDRGARYVINELKAESYKAPVGNGFDVKSILGSSEGLVVNGCNGKLSHKKLQALEARNYRTKDVNTEGDNEFKLIQNLRSDDPEKKISGAELIRFLWRNQAQLVYVLQQEGGDKLDNARMQNAYYEFCHDILVNFGSYGGSSKSFLSKPAEIQQKSNVYKFTTMAFDEKNGIGCKAMSDEEAFSKKASFWLFVVKTFAYDLYQNACDIKGIQDRWVKPVDSEATDAAGEAGYETYASYNEGYFDYIPEDEVA